MLDFAQQVIWKKDGHTCLLILKCPATISCVMYLNACICLSVRGFLWTGVEPP